LANYVWTGVVLEGRVLFAVCTETLYWPYKPELVFRPFLLRLIVGRVLAVVGAVAGGLDDCRLVIAILEGLVVDFEDLGIGIGEGTIVVELRPVAAAFGEFETDPVLAVELSAVDALLAGADVQIVLPKVHQCDLADLLCQRMVLGRGQRVVTRGVTVGQGLGSSVVGGE
jgi:hypothetical protein